MVTDKDRVLKFIPLAAVPDERFRQSRARRPHAILYSYARFAIADALSMLPASGRVLIPALCCRALVEAVEADGHQPIFYDVGPDFTIGPEQITPHISQDPVAVIAISYFGWETALIADLAVELSGSVFCLVDSAHSIPLASHDPTLDRIYSFRKSLGTASGAVWLPLLNGRVAAPQPITPPSRRQRETDLLLAISDIAGSSDLSTAESLLKKRNSLRRTRRFDRTQASPSFDDIENWSTVDFEAVACKRRDNARRYLTALAGMTHIQPAFAQVPDNASPLAFPVWVHNADRFVNQLWQCGIEVARWWPELPPGIDVTRYPNSVRTAQHLVNLPVHQNMLDADLCYVLNALESVSQNAQI